MSVSLQCFALHLPHFRGRQAGTEVHDATGTGYAYGCCVAIELGSLVVDWFKTSRCAL